MRTCFLVDTAGSSKLPSVTRKIFAEMTVRGLVKAGNLPRRFPMRECFQEPPVGSVRVFFILTFVIAWSGIGLRSSISAKNFPEAQAG